MKEIEERLADIIFPIAPSLLSKLYGVDHLSFISAFKCRPPKSLVVEIKKSLRELDPDPKAKEKLFLAVSSPSYRRRLRRQLWAELQTEVDTYIKSFQGILRQCQNEFENLACDECPEVTTSIREVEEQIIREVNELAKKPEALLHLFPINETIDPRHKKHLLHEIGGEKNYPNEVASVIFEYVLYRNIFSSGLRVNLNSFIWRKLGLDSVKVAELLQFPAPVAFVKVFRQIFLILADEQKMLVFLRWLISRLLALKVLGTGSAGAYGREREISLETLVTDNIKLRDTLPNIRGENQVRQIESRIDLEILLADLPATQRRAVEIYREAEEMGMSVKDICTKNREDYEAIRQAFQRVKKKYRCKSIKTRNLKSS